MSYSIHSEEKNNYLLLKVSGDRTPENIVKISQECIQIVNKLEHTKILVDVQELIGRLTISQIYQLITNKLFRLKGQSTLNKVAILDYEKNKSRYRFFETVAHNRGINLEAFHKFSDAKKWLIQ